MTSAEEGLKHWKERYVVLVVALHCITYIMQTPTPNTKKKGTSITIYYLNSEKIL